MRALAFLLVVLVASPQMGGAADALPDSQTIRDRSHAAYGTAPKAFRRVVAYTGTAASGEEVTYRRGDDWREVDTAGPLHTEHGINAGHRWHENENGHVVIDQNDPGLATRETFTTTVDRQSEPSDAYVISTLNAKGFGTREYYDAKTWFVVKRERLTPTGTVTTEYRDFAAFGTQTLARHWSTRDQTSGTQTDFELRENVLGDVTDSDVAIPQMTRLLVTYPAGVDRVVLPAVFMPSGHIVVRVTINGRGLDLLLDSGASSIVLDPAIVHDLGLTTLDKEQSSSNAGRFDTGVAVVPHLGVGSLALDNAVVQVAPMGWDEQGAKLVGLLGFDFLCESRITIDYEHQRVIAERFGSFTAPSDAGTIALDARLGSQVPLITVNVNGAVAERIMMDTGAVGPFLLFDYFARRHPEVFAHSAVAPTNELSGGMGGRFGSERVQLDTFTLGNVAFKRFIGYRVTSKTSYSSDFDGVIGPDFLRFFDVHLDYPDGTIYLVPNATGRQAMGIK